MRLRLSTLVGVLLAAAIFSFAVPVEAEVCGDNREGEFSWIVLGIIEDPDPVPVGIWEPVRVETPVPALNPDGGDREDGAPDIATDFGTGYAQATWSYNTGSDYEIAFSEWTGEEWSDIEFLSSTAADDLDPRADVDLDGRSRVVWWSPSPVETIYLVTRDPGSEFWDGPAPILQPGRRPSVVRFGDLTAVAFERDGAGGGQEVVVAFLDELGGIDLETVASTARTERLDAVVHYDAGQLWVDWKQSDGTFAYSVRGGGGWSSETTIPWNDPSWVGVATVRKIIRRAVLDP